jgi:hypothetical protein
MSTSKASCFTARLCRSFFAIASIAAGALANQSAYAAIDGEATYNGKFAVQSFVPDVRALIVDAATRHGWKITDEKPGELTLELNHAKSHMTVVAKAFYTRSEFWFKRVSAKTYQCQPQLPCGVDPETVQRWMIGLRREAGVMLLGLAIQDAGGSVAPNREAIADTL